MLYRELEHEEFNFFVKNLKILTSYDLKMFCYRLLNNMKVLKIHKIQSYLKLGFLKLVFFREA